MVMVHRLPHAAYRWLAHVGCMSCGHGCGSGSKSRPTRTGHMGTGMRRALDLLLLLAAVHLGHAADSSASEPGILVAVAPAVHGALDQASLAAQRDVELRQGPSDPVAISLVNQAVSAILILGAAGPRVHAVLLLELGRELVNVDRLDVAADGVLHLDAVARVLKGNPLHAVAVLPHDQRRRRRDGARSGIGVDGGRRVGRTLELRRALLVVGLRHGRRLRLLFLQLQGHLGLDLGPWAARHAGLRMLCVLCGVRRHLVLRCRMRHHHVGLRSHRLLMMMGMLRIGRGRRLMGQGLVLRLRLVVHGLLQMLRRRLAVQIPVLVMLRR